MDALKAEPLAPELASKTDEILCWHTPKHFFSSLVLASVSLVIRGMSPARIGWLLLTASGANAMR
jgi:hypothetical protein